MTKFGRLFSVMFILLFALTCIAFSQAPNDLHGGFFQSSVYLTWQHADHTHPSSYNVYREGPSDLSFSVIGTPTFPFYQDSAVAANQAYKYFVTAVDSGESVPSDTIVVQTTPLPPFPPRDLEGEVTDAGFAHLTWNNPENHGSVVYYKIYHAVIPTTTLTAFDSTSSKDYIDNSFNQNSPTLYAVTAVYSPGGTESFFSNIIQLPHHEGGGGGGGHDGHGSIQFTSTPVLGGQIGQAYSYQSTVQTTPPNLHVCFSIDGPNGMVIDSTGLVSWTPDQAGMFEVQIKAKICDTVQGDAEQEFVVLVFSGTPGSISGFVQNQDNQGLPGVIIKLFDVTHGEFVLRATTDSTGHYSFPMVNPATYYLRARPDEHSPYAPQWYSGAVQMDSATAVTVDPGVPVAANFTLLPAGLPTRQFNVSGIVSDTGSTPISGVNVMAFFVSQSGHGHDGFDDGGHDHDAVQTASTDQNGHYSFSLPGGTYIFGAFKHGYLPQFWDHKTSALEATQVALQSDTGNINFNLGSNRGNGIITGTVFSAIDSSRLKSLVLGFQRTTPDSGFTGFTVSTHADSSGNYSLNGLVPGYYVVLAVPKGEFIPTFYNITGGTVFHDSATTVAVNNDSTGGINIYAKPNSAEGLNDISGVVDDGSSQGPSKTNSANPLAGVIVTITNAIDNMPVGSGISSNDGSYSVTGLGIGNYNIYFQAPGKATANVLTNLNYSNNTPTTTTVNVQLSSVFGGPVQPGTMNIQQGWNLVSVPMFSSNMLTTNLFPTAASAAYQYDPSQGYGQSTQLANGQGYWLKFNAIQSFVLPGNEFTSQTINLKQGWNLIGSVSAAVDVSTIITNPGNIVESNYFGFDHGYKTAASIVPGMGYWVKATAAGMLTLNSNGTAAKTVPVRDAITARMNTLKITDAAGNTQTLYFGNSGVANLSKYEMPPVPPAGVFDARFASNRYLENASTQQQSEYPIMVQSVPGTLRLEWSIQDSKNIYVLTNAKGISLTNSSISGNGSVNLSVSGATNFILKVQIHELPKEFALYQNYPNPFNPSTEIRFDLPAASSVTMRIYNVLGQEIATLLNSQPLEAGAQSIHFDASKLSSGVYFYRIQAGSFTYTRKMMLVR